MNRFLKLGVLLVCFQFTCLSISALDKVAPFTLLDKKDVPHAIQFPSPKNYLIIVADKNSSAEAKLFGEDLNKAIGDKAEFVTIAAVGSVPGFLKGSVKGNVKGGKLTLLDWDNKVSKKIGYHESKCLILLVGKDGSILSKQEGTYSKDKTAEVISKLQK